MLKITTSWDDGCKLDLKMSKLLKRYGILGTFYIAKNHEYQPLTNKEINVLSRDHEIGAHTLDHLDLTSLRMDDARHQIVSGKQWLEDVTSRKINMFCYPRGKYKYETPEIVREAGFLGARTTQLGVTQKHQNDFLIPTSIQVYPFPFRPNEKRKVIWRHGLQPLIERKKDYLNMGCRFWELISWESAAKRAIDVAEEGGGLIHLWGHSWEIEKFNMWTNLERVLGYIKSKKNIQYISNSQLIEL